MASKTSFFRRVRLEVVSADPIEMINRISKLSIKLHNLVFCNETTISFTVGVEDLNKLQSFLKKRGCSVRVIHEMGAVSELAKLQKRPLLLILVALAFLTTIFLSRRILFISVEGNERIPEKKLLELARSAGIKEGMAASSVRSEKIKNTLLEDVPELEWVGVNISGCTAVLTVEEKTQKGDPESDKENAVCNIIASRDGVIQNCIVASGKQLCMPGQVVHEGQILVSGYIDLEKFTVATQADAEVEALTFRSINTVAPCENINREAEIAQKAYYSVQIGKKIIKLYKDSGIPHIECAKIYTCESVYLPGGFQLPISLIKETCVCYSSPDDVNRKQQGYDWMKAFAEQYLTGKMISGRIISNEFTFEQDVDCAYFNGEYVCSEIIGIQSFEAYIFEEEIYG